MRQKDQLNRSQKIALLSRLIEGDIRPIRHFKTAQDAPFVYLLDARQVLPLDRLNTLDERPDDLITSIVLTATYANGKPNKEEHLQDMTRSEFERWSTELRNSGFAVVGFLRTSIGDAE